MEGFEIVEAVVRSKFGDREVALFTRRVPQMRSTVPYFLMLVIGHKLAKEIGLNKPGLEAVVSWGVGEQQGKVAVAQSSGAGPSWNVYMPGAGHIQISLNPTPAWVRRHEPLFERSLAFELVPNGKVQQLIVQLPTKVLE